MASNQRTEDAVGETAVPVLTSTESRDSSTAPDLPGLPPRARRPPRARWFSRSTFGESQATRPPDLSRLHTAYSFRSFGRTTTTLSYKETLEKHVSRPSSSSFFYYVQRRHTEVDMPLGVSADQEQVQHFLDIAQERAERRKPNKYRAVAFQILWFFGLLSITYFGLVGYPLWAGAVFSAWHWVSGASEVQYGFLIFILWGTALSWLPLLGVMFEKEVDDPEKRDASETCLIIPAYKAAGALPATIEHALKIFKPNQIFVLANGNSPTPLDNAEDVCKQYGVNHAWVPIGSKIAAEYVGVLLAKGYKYTMLIDDDVHLPANMPLVTDRINEKTKCVGYTIKSTGADGAKGTFVQQAQDIEYKLSGLSRLFSAKYGSALFPHGAIILWDRDVLEKLFWDHPGFKISEDWYFGHTCRFCSQVFVETETPPSLFIPVKSSRGGYGEMTVWKQRFYRWNFFYLYRLRDDVGYLLLAWRLGHLEFVTKLFILGEVYATFVYTVRPFLLPIALVAQPKMAGVLTVAMIAVYIFGIIFFNAVHLRRKKEMVAWKVVPVYFAMKWALTIVNTVSVYYALYAYASFFATLHPRVSENYDAIKAAKDCLERVASEQGAKPADDMSIVEMMEEEVIEEEVIEEEVIEEEVIEEEVIEEEKEEVEEGEVEEEEKEGRKKRRKKWRRKWRLRDV